MDWIKARQKPITGAIAGAIAYVVAQVGIDLDPELSAIIAGAIFTIVVERVGPIFGERARSPAPLR